jgi:hypothetical protein
LLKRSLVVLLMVLIVVWVQPQSGFAGYSFDVGKYDDSPYLENPKSHERFDVSACAPAMGSDVTGMDAATLFQLPGIVSVNVWAQLPSSATESPHLGLYAYLLLVDPSRIPENDLRNMLAIRETIKMREFNPERYADPSKYAVLHVPVVHALDLVGNIEDNASALASNYDYRSSDEMLDLLDLPTNNRGPYLLALPTKFKDCPTASIETMNRVLFIDCSKYDDEIMDAVVQNFTRHMTKKEFWKCDYIDFLLDVRKTLLDAGKGREVVDRAVQLIASQLDWKFLED